MKKSLLTVAVMVAAVPAAYADEFDFRAAQRVGDGERVVDAGIEIKNELLHDCAFLVDWL